MMTSCPPPLTSERRDEHARALCLRMLTARARSRAELAGQLTKRGYPAEVITRVLDRLCDVGLVDDAEFAEQFIHSRRANAAKGKRALAAELRTKGVDKEVIAAALQHMSPATEQERAAQLVQTKLRRESLDGDQQKVARRLVGMLARRGYAEGMAYEVVSMQMGLELERRRT